MSGVDHFEQVGGFFFGGTGYAQPEGALLYAHGEKFRYGEGHASVESQLLGDIAYTQSLAASQFDAASVVHLAEQGQ